MARDYKARFYTDSSNLKGYLKTDKKVTPEYAKQAKTDWKASGTAADIKVLGENLTYVPLDMKPADLQFFGDAEVRYNADRPTVGHPRVNHACRRRWQQPHLQQHRAIVD